LLDSQQEPPDYPKRHKERRQNAKQLAAETHVLSSSPRCGSIIAQTETGGNLFLDKGPGVCYNPRERILCPPPGGKSIGAVSAGLFGDTGRRCFFYCLAGFLGGMTM